MTPPVESLILDRLHSIDTKLDDHARWQLDTTERLTRVETLVEERTSRKGASLITWSTVVTGGIMAGWEGLKAYFRARR